MKNNSLISKYHLIELVNNFRKIVAAPTAQQPTSLKRLEFQRNTTKKHHFLITHSRWITEESNNKSSIT